LNAEEFYHIKWNAGVVPSRQAQSPSGKFLTENVDYAYLDDTLWELLQDKEIREEFKEAIITHYLKAE
jgi:putative restriction endonuclease